MATSETGPREQFRSATEEAQQQAGETGISPTAPVVSQQYSTQQHDEHEFRTPNPTLGNPQGSQYGSRGPPQGGPPSRMSQMSQQQQLQQDTAMLPPHMLQQHQLQQGPIMLQQHQLQQGAAMLQPYFFPSSRGNMMNSPMQQTVSQQIPMHGYGRMPFTDIMGECQETLVRNFSTSPWTDALHRLVYR